MGFFRFQTAAHPFFRVKFNKEIMPDWHLTVNGLRCISPSISLKFQTQKIYCQAHHALAPDNRYGIYSCLSAKCQAIYKNAKAIWKTPNEGYWSPRLIRQHYFFLIHKKSIVRCIMPLHLTIAYGNITTFWGMSNKFPTNPKCYPVNYRKTFRMYSMPF